MIMGWLALNRALVTASVGWPQPKLSADMLYESVAVLIVGAGLVVAGKSLQRWGRTRLARWSPSGNPGLTIKRWLERAGLNQDDNAESHAPGHHHGQEEAEPSSRSLACFISMETRCHVVERRWRCGSGGGLALAVVMTTLIWLMMTAR